MHGRGWRVFLSHDESKGKPTVNRELIKRAMIYARPYAAYIIMTLVLISIASIINLIPPLLYRDLFDTVIPDKDFTRLNWLALGMIGIPILSNLMNVAQRYYSSSLGEGIIYDLRQELYEHLQKMSLRFFTHTRLGEINSRMNSDVVGAQSAVTSTLPNVVTNSFTLITTLIVMFSIEWRLTLLSVIILPLFLIPARRVGHKLRELRRKSMEYNADMSSIISETLTINGALLVKTFGRQSQESERYKDVNGKVKDVGIRNALVSRWFFMGLGIAATIGTALNYWVGGYFVLTDVISIGTIVAFVAYLARLYGPISALTNVQVEFVTSMVSFERVFEYLDMPVEIDDKDNAIELEKAEGRIRFDNVSFDYMEANEKLGIKIKEPKIEGKDHESTDHSEQESKEKETGIPAHIPTRRWALNDLDFEIEPGQLVALVGPSGAGKTTLTYMLPRLYDPTQGCIALDGEDLKNISQQSLAAQMGMVTQETYLFHDTIRANMVYARPDATDEELIHAAKSANIYDFIQSLPGGFDTIVGERGYRLSGGEKQRLAIARVVLKDPRILILDEATSHLDSTSEALIQEALVPLMAGRTSIVIAHRLSTILAADQVLVMDQGALVEKGNHESLLAENGLYATLYETQFRNEKYMD
ncbi:MAG: ABC transporter ATP-binding protein [Chloroflexi bacterium]|nr:ABC transporter ATP-binding protein [Chloroflexota bacterium]MBT3671215.1 ABC transporter ATP-binding protein [Chloroflexota bacterium]MBT4004385.1 ABC transporter ATP-binding protein [Chloroflexota bacterium]MBT4304326.1 ABC transporter ATP-binding protein [Chloroflexota bacterium]MBT4534345.1 ABC transporter ATP-binding protein [Chloroflexota bacterium]